jgi:hypothetical protein
MDHELHWAAQIASAPGTTLLEPRDDASHTNLGWDRSARALAGHPVGGRRSALRLEDATLLVVDEAAKPIATKALAGETLESALAWLGTHYDGAKLRRPEHELPPHPVASGAPFSGAGSPELALLYARADEIISPIATPVRCWPHHFDIAALMSTGDERTIGVGLSPGDASYAEPYWYVTPWPYPKSELPALARGTWHRDGWTGAVLLARHGGDREFLEEAIAACRVVQRSG